jgi:hypothetical protein
MSKLFDTLNSSANLLTVVVFLAALAGFLVLRFIWPSAWEKVRHLVVAKRFWLPVSAVFLIAFVVFLGFSTFYLGYLDHVETNIASLAAAFGRGTPLYHDLASAQRYSLLYGPITYLPFTVALRLLGAKLLSLRLAVLLANVCLLVVLWKCYRKRLDAPRAVLAVAAVVAFMMSGEPYLFQIRGDVLMVLAVSVGLFGVLSCSRWTSSVLLALATAACFGVKVTGVLYFLPLFVLLYRRYGLRNSVLAGLGAGVLGALPFAFPGISAVNYLLWLHEASLHPFRALEFFSNLRTSLTILLPIALLLWWLHDSDRQKFQAYLREEGLVHLALLAGLGMVTLLASKFGSGNHHLLPFYPIVGFLCADIYSRIGNAEPMQFAVFARAICWLWLVSTVATRVPVEVLRTEHNLVARWSLAGAVNQDLVHVMHDHSAERIEMGYSKTYPLSLYRPILVFAGNPLTLDAVALDDMQLSGLSIPQGTIDYIESCGTQIWLIPRDEAPFVISNIYDDPKVFPTRNLFEDRFREAFLDHYQKTGSSNYYDLWSCRKDSAVR